MAKKILLISTITIGLLLRLYKINSPIADWHSHRQADTASVTRLFFQQKIDFFLPRYHDLSNVQSGQNNPNGYRLVELPLYNLLSLPLCYLGLSVELSSRLTSIFLSLASSLLLFLIAQKISRNFFASYLCLLSFLFLPFNIYYSRTILPENLAVTLMLLTLYLFPKHTLLSSVFFALGLLIKPYIGFLLFPVLLYYSYHPRKNFLSLFIFSLISLLPFTLWRLWIHQFPEGVPSSDWLLNSTGQRFAQEWYHGLNFNWLYRLVAFRPYWFRWLFLERVALLILGAFGLIPAFLGLVYRRFLSPLLPALLLFGVFFYFIVVAQGNIQHDYYQVLIIPSLSLLLGFGYYYILNFLFTSKTAALISVIFIFCLSFYFSYYKVKEYYRVNHPEIITAGQKVDQLTPKNSLIIAPYTGDTAFLYQTNRSGWPTEIYDFDLLIQSHPQNPIYLVSANFDQYTNNLINIYPTIYQDQSFIILKITP